MPNMPTLGFAWHLLMNLIEFLIVGNVLAAGKTHFESIVLAALVCIYLQVKLGFTMQRLGRTELTKDIRAEFVRLAGVLNDPEAPDFRATLAQGWRTLESAEMRVLVSASVSSLQDRQP